MFLGFLVAPVFQIVGIGTQVTEAVAGLERTREILNLAREDADPRRTVTLGAIRGEVRFEPHARGTRLVWSVSFGSRIPLTERAIARFLRTMFGRLLTRFEQRGMVRSAAA